MIAHVVLLSTLALVVALLAGVSAYMPSPQMHRSEKPFGPNRVTTPGVGLPLLPPEILDAIAAAERIPRMGQHKPGTASYLSLTKLE